MATTKLYIIRETNSLSKDILNNLVFKTRKQAKKYLTEYIKANYDQSMFYYGTSIRYHIAEDWEISPLKVA